MDNSENVTTHLETTNDETNRAAQLKDKKEKKQEKEKIQGFLKVDDTNLLQRTVTPMFGNNSPSELKVSDFNCLKKSTLNSEEFKNDFPIEDDFEKQISKGIEFENSFSKKNFQIEGQITGEQFWRLPLSDDLFDQLKTPLADMKNTGERYGGSITAALFLQKFIEPKTAWAHLDIAGPARNDKDQAYISAGGSGFVVRTLIELLMGTH